MLSDTICALATPPGRSGIAVIRVSGPAAITALDGLFKGPRPSRQPSHTVRLGWVSNGNGRPLDQVLLTVFRAPRSYTGEHLAELSCHGGQYVADAVLRRLLAAGCRLAGPGEFTRRALLNGKLSLPQAEAVADLVNARTPEAYADACCRYRRAGTDPLPGPDRFRDRVAGLLAEAEYLLGFETEDTVRPRALRERTARLGRELAAAAARAERDRFLHDGARVVIAGRPNVGKSSLFNRLLEADRALVSPTPGTTRDSIEATLMLGPVPARLVDTCGIPARPAGRLNRMAVAAAGRELERADLVVAVLDGSEPARPADHALVASLVGRPAIYVINKTDRQRRLILDLPAGRAVEASCRTGAGIGRLRGRLSARLRPGRPASGRARLEALRAGAGALRRAAAADPETMALELHAGLDALSAPDARVPPGALLDRIFAGFCVGK
ncbi:tRNA modification GTPase [candidate division WOR-3 bacterium]|nr:tRNA modification GTPase [candidate division WOR-3 bacterium]